MECIWNGMFKEMDNIEFVTFRIIWSRIVTVKAMKAK